MIAALLLLAVLCPLQAGDEKVDIGEMAFLQMKAERETQEAGLLSTAGDRRGGLVERG